MLSVTFDTVYSRFLSKVQAYDLLELTMENSYEQLNEWLVSVKADPRVRKMFTSLTFDNVARTVTFELKNPVDDSDDVDFVTEMFGLGIAWKWIEPRYKTVLNTAQFFGGKEQKFYSQANHMDSIEKMYKNSRTDLYKLIASHGSYHNSYVNEEV